MNAVIATAAVAPLLATASVRAEQVTQLILGETGQVVGADGEWLRIRADGDGYEGWAHQGYLRRVDAAESARWRIAATAWSEGARVEVAGVTRALPLRARVGVEGSAVLLPDGSRGSLADGTLRDETAVRVAALRMPAERWALERFGGAPYEWGGLTPWGVDCSGLVQTAFLARGVAVPRDSSQQALHGVSVPIEAARPGDLLFFRSESGGAAITHVAFLAADQTIIHSTIACGGVVHEPFTPGSRADGALQPRLVAARRFAA